MKIRISVYFFLLLGILLPKLDAGNLVFKEGKLASGDVLQMFTQIPLRVLNIERLKQKSLVTVAKEDGMEVTYYYLYNFGKIQKLAIAKGKNCAKLYFDQDFDNNLAEEKPIIGVQSKGKDELFIFDNFSLKTGRNGNGKIVLLANNSARIYTKGYYEGMVDFNGKKIKVRLADADFDGKLTIPQTTTVYYERADSIEIDLDSNGKFEYQKGEVGPLSRYVCFEGKYYEYVIDKDNFSINDAKFKMGTIDVGINGRIYITSEKLNINTDANADGKVIVPVDKYSVRIFCSGKKDVKNNIWRVTLYLKSRTAVVSADKELKYSFTEPIISKAVVRQRKGSLSINVVSNDAKGLRVSGFTCNGKRVQAPKIIITDMKGKLLHEARLHYG